MIVRTLIGLAILSGTTLLAPCASAVLAQQAGTPAATRDPAAMFGAREAVDAIRLSPTGAQIAFVSPLQG